MNTDDWTQLKALFHSALERTGAGREAFVENACREHPTLQDQLRALINSDAEAADFMEQPALAVAAAGAAGGPSLGIGDVLDQTYEVEAVLGSGGMGIVYRVRHRALARSFAAKLIHSEVADDPIFLERFAREAAALGKLKHPNIVDVTDFGVDRDGTERPYLVMEYLQGRTLHERVRARPLAGDVALPLFFDVAAAIDYAHQQGVLHLDLKPGNVLLVEEAGRPVRPKILDFGLAQFLSPGDGPAADSPALPIGTPKYMAPELLTGERPGPAADIYSLGVMMYEVLVGRVPFDGATPQVLEQQRHVDPPPPSHLNRQIPPELDAALIALLAKSPTARPATARAAVTLVHQAMLAASQRQWRRREIPRRLGAAAAIAFAVALSAPLWQTSLVRGLEHQTVDARFAFGAGRPPGRDVVLLLLDDASLAADGTPLTQTADRFGHDLMRIFDAGARAIAVDFLLSGAWSNSGPFAQLTLRHADRLTLAAFSTAPGEVVGPECISGATTVALGAERASGLFGFVNTDQDDDGVSRRARLFYRDREGAARASFAARAVSTMSIDPQRDRSPRPEDFWIDHTIDAGRFERVSWKDLDLTLGSRPDLFRDRLVIVGGDYSGSGDNPRVPNHGAMAGVLLQAIVVETILSNFPVRDVTESAARLATVATCFLVCAAALLTRHPYRLGLTMLLAGVTYAGGAFLVFSLASVMLPVVEPLLSWTLAGALACGIRLYRPAFPEA